jgi:hypothetical protein
MVTITLDEVIRKTLHKHGLPLHYYLSFLVIARDGLKELKFQILPSEGTAELTLDTEKECDLPEDFVGEVGVYKAEGDKLIPIPKNPLISDFDTTTPFDKSDNSFSFGAALPMYIDEFRGDVGRQFGQVNPREGYRIITDLNKIRVDNNTELEKVYLKYVTLPKKVSNKTLVHPLIEPALVAFINWQLAFYANDPSVMMKRQEFFNQRRIAKANLYRINIVDILSSFRMYHNQAIKS